MRGFRASSVQTFKIEPDHVGGKLMSVEILTANIAVPAKKGRKALPPESYLLIGFDTEYQTFEAVDVREVRSKAIEAKNEVLSYQFSVKAVHQDGSASTEVTDIIVPEKQTRIRIDDFIAFAIGCWSEAHPNVVIPCDIYLTGHFTRADLPGFNEFHNNVRQMTNVRNTFVSVNSSVRLRIEGRCDRKTEAEFKVRFRDTFLLAPANAKSLGDIGKIVGTEKVALHSDPLEEVAIKENMKALLHDDWPKFRQYAVRDGEVCVRYAERIIRQHNDLFQQFRLPVTLNSFGSTLVVDRWEKDGLDVNDVLGREGIEEKKFSQHLGYYKKTKTAVYIEEVHWREALVTESYHGGRNEQFVFGIADEGDWRDLDLSSAYTTAMSLIGYPNWAKIKTVKSLKQIKFDDLAYCSIDFEFPKNVRFPVFPVRTQNGIIFPRKGKTVCAAPELLVARELGAKIKIKEGCMVVTDRTKPIFKTFIQDCIGQRSKYDKSTFDNLFWKEVGNSTYGKTAQGLRQKRVYDLRDDEMVELPPSRLTQPFFASFITSYVRAVLGEMLNALPSHVQVFSVTTDGFLSTASEADIDKVMKNFLAQFSKKQGNSWWEGKVLEEKHRIRQPIGWRTRGSATLMPGRQRENNIVLQKGGIKTNEVLEGAAENSYIVGLFFNRYPGQKIKYTIGLGIRDMVSYDADFVRRRMEKLLRMEYDFKRRPINIREVKAEFEGKAVSHLSYDTEPLEDIEEFRRYRDAWDDYTQKTKACLKTVADYEQFAKYVQTKKLPRTVAAYISKKDGDLKRLTRDLCRAFTDKHPCFGNANVPYKTFATMLKSCGLPCTVNNVDYAKRVAFKPNQCIASDAAKTALQKLKERFFPDLDEAVFFAEL